MLVHHHSHPTTPAGVGFDNVISDSVSLITEKGFASKAALGEAEVIRLVVDDPNGTYDFKTLHRWYMVETSTSGEQLVWNGYITDQYISRGDEGEYIHPIGAGRQWELEITQENTLLGFRVIQGAATAANGVRPTESPGARLNWLLASPFLSTVQDHGLIDWTGLNALAAMEATNYQDQTGGDVLKHISLITGWNHYIRYNDTHADIELAMYAPNNTTLDVSTLKISNDSADLSATGDFDTPLIYAPSEDSRLHRKGDRVAAGVLVKGANGIRSYGYDLSTSYEFGFRDMVITDNNTKTQAQADALRTRVLNDHDEQDERVNTRIQVTAAQLNAVKHGQLMQAKFTHFPNWTSYRQARVITKTFSRPQNRTQAKYDVDLELSPIAAPVVCSAGNCQGFNQNYNVTLPECLENGDVVVAVVCSRQDTGSSVLGPEAWTTAVDHLIAYNIAQYPGPGPYTKIDVYYRTWSTGDSAVVNVQPNQPGTITEAIVLKDVSGAPTVTSGTGTKVAGEAVSIGPTAGAGTLLGVFGFQRNDANQQNPGFAVNVLGATTTIDVAGSTWDGECGISWAPRRWIGYVEGTTALTLQGTLANPGNQENLWGFCWVGLYWAS